MKIDFRIEFDREFVFGHRNDDVLPVDYIKRALAGEKNVAFVSATLTDANFCMECSGAPDLDTVKQKINAELKKAYPDEKIEFEFKHKIGKPANGEGKNAASIANDIGTKSGNRAAADSDEIGEISERIKGLVGADEFKALAREIISVAPSVVENPKHRGVFMRRSYIFSVGDGCGLTSYVNLLAELISKSGIGGEETRVTEKKLDAFSDSAEPFKAVSGLFRRYENVTHVVCIDISEWLGHTDNRFFKEFLRDTEKNSDDTVIVFRVPFVDKDVLGRLIADISDVMFIKTISVPPFAPVELKAYAQRLLGEYGFKAADKAWRYFGRRITEEKRDGKFYGVATVKKVVDELVFRKLLSNSASEKPNDVVSVSDMLGICADPDAAALSGEEQLDKLVGCAELKAKIREIVAHIETAADDKNRPCIHMQFVGNPGTGKTTVARIIGRMLKEKGVLSIGNFHEHSGRDLCGRYVGETAPKTSSICRDAYGSVLFIDEAYSLYRGDDSGRDFGIEALDTLIAEMENYRNDFVVILAGYTDDMNRLMQGNRGLKSRIPYTVEFPNFTRDELYGIFENMATERFKCDDDMLAAAREFFATLPDALITSKDFANARFVRNLFERTWSKASMRCQLGKIKAVRLTRDDFERAKSEKEFTLNTKVRPRIGFSY